MERSCDNCKYINNQKKCSKCISSDKIIHSKFKPESKLFEIIQQEITKWNEIEEAMKNIEKHKENNMEYKTKEELQSSIEKMETELAKMKEALKKTEEEDIFWKPAPRSGYHFINGEFVSAYTWMENDRHDNGATKAFNCFETYEECKDAARDFKTLFMLYRLSKKSMDKCCEMAAFYLMKYSPRTNTIYWELTDRRERGQLCCFSTHADAVQAYKIIGKENLIELFKKF